MKLDDLRFTKEHEWVAVDGSLATVGITDFAQSELGDIVFVELPEVGSEVKSTETMGTIEAVKTVADLFAPISGVVKAVNPDLEENPGVVNQSPYEGGWFVKIEVTDQSELEGLMTHAAYKELIGAE